MIPHSPEADAQLFPNKTLVDKPLLQQSGYLSLLRDTSHNQMGSLSSSGYQHAVESLDTGYKPNAVLLDQDSLNQDTPQDAPEILINPSSETLIHQLNTPENEKPKQKLNKKLLRFDLKTKQSKSPERATNANVRKKRGSLGQLLQKSP